MNPRVPLKGHPVAYRLPSPPHVWTRFFWNFRTEFEPHWDFLESWRRGWFPRNVSDAAALDTLNVCDDATLPLAPTVTPPSGGSKGEAEETYLTPPPLVENILLLLGTGALGGALVTLAATRLFTRAPVEPQLAGSTAEYVAMGDRE